jgi:hypothetical protein
MRQCFVVGIESFPIQAVVFTPMNVEMTFLGTIVFSFHSALSKEQARVGGTILLLVLDRLSTIERALLHSKRAVNNLGLIQQIQTPLTFHASYGLPAY